MKSRAELLIVLAIVLVFVGCQSATEPSATEEAAEPEAAAVDPTPGEMVATGVFRNRSGEPIADALVVFGRVITDSLMRPETVQLGPTAIIATTDEEGKFTVDDFEPGEYALVYQPSGTSARMPAALIVNPLAGNAESFMPGLEDVEIGKDSNYEERTWGTGYVLLKGHTLFAKDKLMSIYNATVRTGSVGPYVEWRKGNILTVDLQDNAEIEIDAWSY